MRNSKLSVETVRRVLGYDPETGVFHWKLPTARKIAVGQQAGVVAPNGRRVIAIYGEKVLAQRLAWFYVHGEWPQGNISPRDGNYDNARLDNLVRRTPAETVQNGKMRSTNNSGVRGVSWSASKDRWVATITRSGQRVHLGYFAELADAASAVRAAEAEFPGTSVGKVQMDAARNNRRRANIVWSRIQASAQPTAWLNFAEFLRDVVDVPTLDRILVPVDPAQPLGVGNFSWQDKPMRTSVAEANRRYRENNVDLIREKGLLRDFGIDLATYQRMFVEQQGVCAICAQPETAARGGKTKWLAVDHDHDTGAVRGLCCSDCNTGIGKMGDDPIRLRAAADYIEHHRSLNSNVVSLTKKGPT